MADVDLGANPGPGEIAYGFIHEMPLPSGGMERWPVIVARGRERSPTFWITANVHGNELNGLAVVQRIAQSDALHALRGTLVMLPTVNPAGLRTNSREPYWDPQDPNRLFPGESGGEWQESKSVYERIADMLFEKIRHSANYLVDLHTASLGSVPFTIRDRVLYRQGEHSEADHLSRTLAHMVRAFGLPVVNEYGAEKYVKRKLNRSLSGAVLNEARIPAFTAELSGGQYVQPDVVEAGVVACFNVLRWAEMLPGHPERVPHLPELPDMPVVRSEAPRATMPGIAQHLVRAGDVFGAGATIARQVDVFGRPLPDGDLRAEKRGWVIGLRNSITVYPGQPVASLALEDNEPLVAPFPEQE